MVTRFATVDIEEGYGTGYNQAWDGYTFQSPYNNGSFVIYSNADSYDGYNFVIRKAGELDLGRVTVDVDLLEGYQDIIYNLFPPAGTVDRPRDTEIRFRIINEDIVPSEPFLFEGIGGFPGTFKLYAYTIQTGSNIQIYESSNDGATWSLHSTLAAGIAESRAGQGFRRLHGNNSNYMFAAAQEKGVYKWNGTNWTQVIVPGAGGVPAGTRFLSVYAYGQYVAAVGHTFAGTCCSMFSPDYGASWSDISANLNAGIPAGDQRGVPRNGTPITKLSSVAINWDRDGYNVCVAGSDSGGGIVGVWSQTFTPGFGQWTVYGFDDGGDGHAIWAAPYEWIATGTTVGGVAQVWRYGAPPVNLGTTLSSPQASYTSITGEENFNDVWIGSPNGNIVSRYDGSSWTNITISGGIDQIYTLFGEPNYLTARQLWFAGSDSGDISTCVQSNRPPDTAWLNRNIGISNPRICIGLFGTYQ